MPDSLPFAEGFPCLPKLAAPLALLLGGLGRLRCFRRGRWLRCIVSRSRGRRRRRRRGRRRLLLRACCESDGCGKQQTQEQRPILTHFFTLLSFRNLSVSGYRFLMAYAAKYSTCQKRCNCFFAAFSSFKKEVPARVFYFPPKRRSHSLSNSPSEKYETSNLPFFGVPRMRTLVPPLRDSRSSRSFRCGLCRGGLRGVAFLRSEERRVGKECRSRWSPYH